MQNGSVAIIRFQSTHPLRGATRRLAKALELPLISIHAPLAGCDVLRNAGHNAINISIHAPLAGCDRTYKLEGRMENCISIHAPLAGCDVVIMEIRCLDRISIHAPLAGCDAERERTKAVVQISIHAPLAGCDQMHPPLARNRLLFQSTHPLRGATYAAVVFQDRFSISIHAPLAGCDGGHRNRAQLHLHFNPRTPCGVRQRGRRPRQAAINFNPRTPCGVRP